MLNANHKDKSLAWTPDLSCVLTVTNTDTNYLSRLEHSHFFPKALCHLSDSVQYSEVYYK